MRRHGMTLGCLAVAAATAIGAATAGAATAGTLARPTTSSSGLIETSQANAVAGKINTIGINRYSQVFAGVIPTSPSTLDVSEVAAGAATLNANIHTVAAASGVAITYSHVSNSFSRLENVTTSIAQHQTDLKDRGIILQSWGPNPSHDIVLVTLQPGSVSTSAAQSVLDGMYGSGIIAVSSTTAPPFKAAGRENDVSPFTAGDAIQVLGSQDLDCTSSWSMQGRSSGNPFILAAGHCGNGAVTIAGSGNSVGSVSTQYFSNNGYDFESIATSGDRGDVWEGGPGYSSVTANAVSAYSVPPADSYMTFERVGNGTSHGCLGGIG